jgi:hypothetical protein
VREGCGGAGATVVGASESGGGSRGVAGRRGLGSSGGESVLAREDSEMSRMEGSGTRSSAEGMVGSTFEQGNRGVGYFRMREG